MRHIHLPIYKVAYDLLDKITDLAKNMPSDFAARWAMDLGSARVMYAEAGVQFETVPA